MGGFTGAMRKLRKVQKCESKRQGETRGEGCNVLMDMRKSGKTEGREGGREMVLFSHEKPVNSASNII